MDDIVERLREQGEQKSAAARRIYGLPIIVTESDTQKGKSALWMDNGMAGCGQVAISTGEFPCAQTDAIGALANIAAATDYDRIADKIQSLQADNAALREGIRRYMNVHGVLVESDREYLRALIGKEQAMKLSDRVEALTGPDRDVFIEAWEAINGSAFGILATDPRAENFFRFVELLDARAYLDAAMMLLPVFETEDGPMQADFILECVNGWLAIGCRVGHDNPNETSWAETPAIALTCAALRAQNL